MADENDLDILAWTMLGEAAGQGSGGMADVANVVLNRLNTGKYGSSIADVAKSPKQFSTWNSGAGGNNPTGRYPKSSPEFKRARELASQVVAGNIPGPPGTPLDYNAPEVSPYWADSKSQYGSYERNGHVYYPSTPIPPGEIPNTVGTLTDTVEPAPMPVTPLPSTAAMRGMTSPSGGNGALQTALGQYATRERNRVTPQMPPVVSAQTIASFPSVPQGQDLTSPGGVNSYVGGMQQDPGLAAALAQRSAFNGDPLTPAAGQVVASIPSMPAPRRTVPQSAIERVPNSGLAFNGDPMTPAAGPVVASIPSRPAMSSAAISYAGQERATAPARTASAPMPALPSPQLAGRRAVDPGLQAALDARYPAQLPQVAPPSQVPSSGVGLPPATRVAQSIPMQAPQALPQRQQVGVSDMVRGFTPDTRERLPSTPMAGARATAPQALPGPFSVATLTNNVNEFGLPVTVPSIPGSNPVQVGQSKIAPIPFPSYRAVGSQVATTPPMSMPRRIAPVPVSAQVRDIARNGSWIGNVFTPPDRPITSAEMAAQARSRPRSLFGAAGAIPQLFSRTQMPQLTPQQAVNQSGDNSVGNQAEAAATRASAQSYRDAQARKR